MASKSTFLVLGAILAVFLLITSDVAARELAEDTKKENTKVEISVDGRGGYNKIPSASVDGRGGYNKIPYASVDGRGGYNKLP